MMPPTWPDDAAVSSQETEAQPLDATSSGKHINVSSGASDIDTPTLPDGAVQPHTDQEPATRLAASGQEKSLVPRRPRGLRGSRVLAGIAVIVLLVALLGGGVVFVLAQLAAPAQATSQFCGDLTNQRYDAAYSRFSPKLRTQLTSAEFTQAAATLDQIEGRVTSCAATNGNGYHYSLGSDSASVGAILSRSKQGKLSGILQLKKSNGTWQIEAIDTALLGVNVQSLRTANAFCAALRNHDYTAAYAQLDHALQTTVTTDAFATQAKLHDAVDGAISGCGLVAVGHGNSDRITHLSVALTRKSLGARSGSVALAFEDGVWKISQFDAGLFGSDLGAIQAGQTFCADLTANNYTGAYGILTAAAQTDVSQDEFTRQFNVSDGIRWAGCTADLTTYSIANGKATYTTALKAVSSYDSTSLSLIFKLTFLQEGGSWKLDDWELVNVTK